MNRYKDRVAKVEVAIQGRAARKEEIDDDVVFVDENSMVLADEHDVPFADNE